MQKLYLNVRGGGTCTARTLAPKIEVSLPSVTLTLNLRKGEVELLKKKFFNALPTELHTSLARTVGLEPTNLSFNRR